MTLRSRLRRLEEKARHSVSAGEMPDWLTEEGWLSLFEAWGREGHFSREPEFPEALAAYRAAVEQAQAGSDPPFDPPPDFMPNTRDLPHLRLLNWRTQYRFPDVCRGLTWLFEMLERV